MGSAACMQPEDAHLYASAEGSMAAKAALAVHAKLGLSRRLRGEG
jgi:hypothetical protein